MSALSIESLTIGYRKGKQKLVLQKDIALNLDKGEMISIIGQNGVGKSTFIKSILGLIPLLGGSVYLEDSQITQLSV